MIWLSWDNQQKSENNTYLSAGIFILDNIFWILLISSLYIYLLYMGWVVDDHEGSHIYG